MGAKHRLIGLAATAVLVALSSGASAAPARSPVTDPFQAQITAAKSAMMGQPQLAFERAQAALALAKAQPAGHDSALAAIQAEWLSAEALTRLKQADKALPILDDALKAVAAAAPNTELQGDVLKSHGRAAAAMGRIQQALQDFQAAFRIYQRADKPRSEAIALQEIGSIYSDARDYAHVLQYYNQSREVFTKDPALNLAAHNNQGFALKDTGKLKEAEGEFRQALEAAIQLHSVYLQADILTNVAYTQALAGDREAAREAANRGLALARNPEASSERPFLTGVLAKVAADSGDVAGAARLLDQVFAGQDLDSTAMAYRDFHEIAAGVYDRIGDKAKALAHLKAFKRLDDQGRALAASTNAALMAAQFDFANQNLRITQLKAGQLERDMMIARSRARLRSVITTSLFIAGGAILIATLLGFLSMRRSRDRIRAANDRLETANTALQKALKAKTDFLATTSHEIRTPLNGILGMTQVILADNALSGTVRERVQLVHGAGETMRLLVDDLLDLAKIETGAITVDPRPFDLTKVLGETARFWKGQAAVKSLSVRLDTSAAPAAVIGDETRLRQILYNLMSNAIKFTAAGGVELVARAEGDDLLISVTDSGIGIPADKHSHVFEAFAQADSSTSRQYGGAGLGLSICRKVSEAMGGDITLRSAPGEGSTFTLRLPLVLAPGASQPSSAGPVSELSQASVVLMERNPLSQSILRAIIEPQAGRFTVAPSLDAALDQLKVERADLVIADGPTLAASAPSVLSACRSMREAAPDMRLVVLAPAADEELTGRLAGCGVDLIVSKPIAAADLLASLRSVLLPREIVETASAA